MTRVRGQGRALVCPGCGRRAEPAERFCAECRLPLVIDVRGVTPAPLTERQRHARLIKPQLTEGELVRVAGARNQSEAEFIQSLLLEEGVPSMLRRSAGFDVPDMLAAGPRDILVARSALDTAREVLLEAEIVAGDPPAGRSTDPWRLLAGLLVALALGGLVIVAIAALLH